MSDAGERNQAPTAMRLQQARAAGDIPRSAELAASLSMLGAIGAAYLTFSNISKWLQRSTTDSWSLNRAVDYSSAYSSDAVVEQMQTLLFDLAGVLLPFMASIVLITIAANWIQTGPIWLPAKAVPDVSNLGLGKWKQKFGLLNLFGIGGVGSAKNCNRSRRHVGWDLVSTRIPVFVGQSCQRRLWCRGCLASWLWCVCKSRARWQF